MIQMLTASSMTGRDCITIIIFMGHGARKHCSSPLPLVAFGAGFLTFLEFWPDGKTAAFILGVDHDTSYLASRCSRGATAPWLQRSIAETAGSGVERTTGRAESIICAIYTVLLLLFDTQWFAEVWSNCGLVFLTFQLTEGL